MTTFDIETFAAERSEELTELIEALVDDVRTALAAADAPAALAAVVRDHYAARGGAEIESFTADLSGALALTTPDPDDDGQARRIASWLATAIMGAEAFYGASPGATKTWVSMRDGDVRPLHVEVDGTTVPLAGTFNLAGTPTRYPGEPVGPVENWINCRCVLHIDVDAVETFAVDPDDQPDLAEDELDDIDPDELDEAEDELDPYETGPMEWHAVLTVEGVPSGDRRRFANNALEWRDLPLPLEWQEVTAKEHDGAYTVGVMSGLTRSENQIRAWGHFVANDKADELIGLISEGAVRSISPTVDDVTLAVDDEPDETGEAPATMAKARICSATVVNVGAFPEAVIKLGPPPTDWVGDAPEVELTASTHFREFTEAERKRAADEGHAMPDGSYPIKTVADLLNAIQAIGRAKNPDAVKRHIRKRARALDATELIPDTWAADTENFQPRGPGDKRGAGWVTHPRETRRLHRYWTRGPGAAKIRWGQPHDFYRCRRQLAKYISPPYLNRTCAEWHHDALGYWPGEHHGGDTEHLSTEDCPCENLALVASSAPTIVSHELFENPNLTGPTGSTYDPETGRCYGHLATWGTCHLSFAGNCVEPPRSNTNYAYFHTGEVQTDKGPLAVGVITMDTLHASTELDAKSAARHYEDTGAIAAMVRCGEDDYGIWFSGVPLLDDDAALSRFRLASLSGDWRRIGGNLELVSALAVNSPGFPIPRTSLAASAGHIKSLVAANPVAPKPDSHTSSITPLTTLPPNVDPTELGKAIVAALTRREARRKKLAAFRRNLNQERAAALVAAVEGEC